MLRINAVVFLWAALSAAPLFAQAGMVLVEGGTFQMGSNNGHHDEMPVHTVTVGSFFMARYEVTQEEWAEIMGSNPSYYKGDNLPVDDITWYEAVEYCNRLSQKEGLAPAYRGSGDNIVCDFNAPGFRLPTEAEWEYAAGGGNNGPMAGEYSGWNDPDATAWYDENSGDTPHPVGTKQPNSLGLYDMSGNIEEWCWDWYGSYGGESQTNPTGPLGPATTRTGRVIRGGCFAYPAFNARSANRNGLAPLGRGDNIGFRLARSQPSGGGAAPVRKVSDNMVLVEGGTFQMGSGNGENWEKPVHEVTLKSFFMGKYEVTQGEWAAIMESNPGRFEGDTLPVESITWYEAVEYCNRLSIMEKLTPAYRGSGDKIICDFDASGFRLPTEAEWEYAAKGGNKDPVPYEYSGGNNIDSVAWYIGNSGGTTRLVGIKQPNSLGLYDMSGNVGEWCWDWYGSYGVGNLTDPPGPSTGTNRVSRGGNWNNSAEYLRSYIRDNHDPLRRDSRRGFRLVRSRPAPLAAQDLPVSNVMVLVEGGTFQMGSVNHGDAEKPVHEVTVRSFFMGKCEVTQKEWTEIMGTTVQEQWAMVKDHILSLVSGVGDTYPVYAVNWYEAVEYCNRLSQKEGLAPAYRGSGDNIVCDFNAPGYRLPTEAEWEYAARGGNKDAKPFEYSGGNIMDEVAWHPGNSNGTTHPVGTKQPNSLGIYDMSGNVWEWCWDRYGRYADRPQTDPTGPSPPVSSGIHRVARGGAWFHDPDDLRSTKRSGNTPSGRHNNVGFRLVRSLPD